ncbi:hypothetical protein QT383_05895 [Stenotrophomonas rhizophila]
MTALPRILPITVIDSNQPVPAEAGHHHGAAEGEGRAPSAGPRRACCS